MKDTMDHFIISSLIEVEDKRNPIAKMFDKLWNIIFKFILKHSYS